MSIIIARAMSLLGFLLLTAGLSTANARPVEPFELRPASNELDRSDRGFALYAITGGGVLTEYDLTGNQIGRLQLSDTNAMQMCGDQRGNIYVVDNKIGESYANQLIERFRIGSTKPSLTFYWNLASNGEQGYGCTANPATRDLVVFGETSNTFSFGVIAQFAYGQTYPYYTAGVGESGGIVLVAATFGPDNNIWASAEEVIHPELASKAGNWSLNDVPRDYTYGVITGIQFDSQGNFLLEDANDQQIDIYPPNEFHSRTRHHKAAMASTSISNGGVVGFKTVYLTGTSGGLRNFLLTPSEHELFTFAGSNIDGFRYPAGGNPVVVVQAGAVGFTIARRRNL